MGVASNGEPVLSGATLLTDLTWQEVESYLASRRSIVVPVGSTEQHGSAGTLGTDTLVAIGLCQDVSARTGVLVAPPIWTGDSSHHAAFPGTIWLRSSTLIALVTDVAASLASAGFTRQVWVNGHKGSNLPALTLALRELHEYRFRQALFAVADPLHLGRAEAQELKTEPEHHGGALELSQVMYLRPDNVRTDRLGHEQADLGALAGGWLTADLFGSSGFVDIPWNSVEERAFAATGAIGSSASASVELGQAYHDALVGRLAEFTQWFESWEGFAAAPPDRPVGSDGSTT